MESEIVDSNISIHLRHTIPTTTPSNFDSKLSSHPFVSLGHNIIHIGTEEIFFKGTRKKSKTPDEPSTSLPTGYPQSYLKLIETLKGRNTRYNLVSRCYTKFRIWALSSGSLSYPKLAPMLKDLLKPFESAEMSSILSSTPMLIVAGAVNAGKSSLINVLLGRRVVPSDEMPSTTRCVKITSSRSRRPTSTVQVKEWCGYDTADITHLDCGIDTDETVRTKLLSLDEKEGKISKRCWRYVQVDLHHPLLSADLDIVECPAIDSPTSYKEVADMIRGNTLSLLLYMFDGTDLVSIEDMNFLKFIKATFPSLPIFYVVNKMEHSLESHQYDQCSCDSISIDSIDSKSGFMERQHFEPRENRLEKILDDLHSNQLYTQGNLVSLSNAEILWELETGKHGENVEVFEKFLTSLSQWLEASLFRCLVPVSSRLSIIVKAFTDAYIDPQIINCEALLGKLTKQKDILKRFKQDCNNGIATTLSSRKKPIVRRSADVSFDERRASLQSSSEDSAIGLEILYSLIENKMLTELHLCLDSDESLFKGIQMARDDTLLAIERSLLGCCSMSLGKDYSTLFDHLFSVFAWKKLSLSSVELLIDSCLEAKQSAFQHKVVRKLTQIATRLRSDNADLTAMRTKINISDDLFQRIAVERIASRNFDQVISLTEFLLDNLSLYLCIQRQLSQVDFVSASHDFQNRFLIFDLAMESLRRVGDMGDPKMISKFNSESPVLFRHQLESDYGEFTKKDTMIRTLPCAQIFKSREAVTYLFSNRILKKETKGILQPRGVTLNTKKEFLFMMLAMQTDIFVELNRDDGPRWTMMQVMDAAQQVLAACDFLRSASTNCLHADLRPENLLITFSNDRLKLKLSIMDPPDFKRPYPNGEGPFHYKDHHQESFHEPQSLNEIIHQTAVLFWWMGTKRLQPPPSTEEIEKSSHDDQFSKIIKSKSRDVSFTDLKFSRLLLFVFKPSFPLTKQRIIQEIKECS